MKNIHVLPTDKPSRLIRLSNGELRYNENSGLHSFYPQNIYITSDEEIKDGFVLHLPTNRILEIGVFTQSNGSKSFREKEYHINGIEVLICDCEKIILTTDKDLIKYGVQAIDDEFLEWFVKHPNCERVDIETIMECEKCGKEHCDNLNCRGYKDIPYYKIIIPKEEPKQICEYCKIEITKYGCGCGTEKPKQETLEEVALKYFPKTNSHFDRLDEVDGNAYYRSIFKQGAKWQQEQIGKSEFLQRLRGTLSDAEARRLIFEQFKNK